MVFRSPLVVVHAFKDACGAAVAALPLATHRRSTSVPHLEMRSHVLKVLLSASVAYAQLQTGTLFNFVPGLGACGFTNDSTQIVASVSSVTFNTFPGATANPNDNPICKTSLNITHTGVTLIAPIVDFCEQCGGNTSIGLSPPGFEKFAPLSQGIVTSTDWEIIGS